MANLKNFFNPILNDGRIFTREDIGNMSTKEYSTVSNAIDYQLSNLGVPRNSDLVNNSDTVYVSAYTRDDGTEVKSHYRTRPDGLQSNNFSNSHYATNSIKKADFSSFDKNRIAINTNNYLNQHHPNAKEMFNLFLIDAENAPESDEYSIISKSQTRRMNKMLNFERTDLEIDNSWSGIAYNEKSSLSKNLSNSPQLQRQVISHYLPNSNSFDTDKILVGLNEDSNLHLSIGHCTILNPKIENGYFTGVAFDKYDFRFMKEEYEKTLDVAIVNNFATLWQNLEWAKNYYTLTPIMFRVK